MGYNLYITRNNSCTDDTVPEITADEWLAVFDMNMNPVNRVNRVDSFCFFCLVPHASCLFSSLCGLASLREEIESV